MLFDCIQLNSTMSHEYFISFRSMRNGCLRVRAVLFGRRVYQFDSHRNGKMNINIRRRDRLDMGECSNAHAAGGIGAWDFMEGLVLRAFCVCALCDNARSYECISIEQKIWKPINCFIVGNEACSQSQYAGNDIGCSAMRLFVLFVGNAIGKLVAAEWTAMWVSGPLVLTSMGACARNIAIFFLPFYPWNRSVKTN